MRSTSTIILCATALSLAGCCMRAADRSSATTRPTATTQAATAQPATTQPAIANPAVVVITDHDDVKLDNFVNQRVRLVGIVHAGQPSQMHGVDVNPGTPPADHDHGPATQDPRCWAEGYLLRRVVSQFDAEYHLSGRDHAGTYYLLLDPMTSELASACPLAQREPPPVVPQPAVVLITETNGIKLAHHIGERVRLEGVVRNSKQASLVGVDVDEPSEPIPGDVARRVIHVRKKRCCAEGILLREVIRPEQVDPMTQNRGPGTFYSLLDQKTGERACAYPFDEHQ